MVAIILAFQGRPDITVAMIVGPIATWLFLAFVKYLVGSWLTAILIPITICLVFVVLEEPLAKMVSFVYRHIVAFVSFIGAMAVKDLLKKLLQGFLALALFKIACVLLAIRTFDLDWYLLSVTTLCAFWLIAKRSVKPKQDTGTIEQ